MEDLQVLKQGVGQFEAGAPALGEPTEALTLDLVVALNTVKKHVTHVLGKLGAANRTEAVARARQLGLIP